MSLVIVVVIAAVEISCHYRNTYIEMDFHSSTHFNAKFLKQKKR